MAGRRHQVETPAAEVDGSPRREPIAHAHGPPDHAGLAAEEQFVAGMEPAIAFHGAQHRQIGHGDSRT